MVGLMKNVLFLYFLCFIFFTNSYELLAEEERFECVKSLPDEVSALQTIHDFQIGGIVSPVSGYPYLQETDLIAKGAEEIALTRVFLSPHLPTSFDSQSTVDDYTLHQFLDQNYKGWVNFPHTHLEYADFYQPKKIRLTTENGASIDFKEVNGKFVLEDAYGVSNLGADGPGGMHDLRNITLAVDGKEVIAYFPDGTIRYYFQDPLFFSLAPHPWFNRIYRLEKEIRPNGKVWRFKYDEKEMQYTRKLIGVQSTSPDGQIVYASISINKEPLPNTMHKKTDYRDIRTTKGIEKVIRQETNTVFTTNSGQTATYQYEILNKLLSYKKERAKVTSPHILKAVNSPFYSHNVCNYSDYFLLKKHESHADSFACTYKGFVQNKKTIQRVDTIYFPGQSAHCHELAHTIDYDSPIAGKKRGNTKVVNSDGSSLVYHISENMLIDKIQYLNQKGALHKQTTYRWDANQRCRSIEYCDGNQVPLYTIYYEFDGFGNPVQEVIKGNITGEGGLQTKVIIRSYSQDGRNLLLTENHVGGIETRYQYLPQTNLITQKLTLANSTVHKREIFNYDNYFNLVEEIVDNGTSENGLDLTGVTERTFKRYELRREAPFIHMCEWIVEGAWENGYVRILKKDASTL